MLFCCCYYFSFFLSRVAWLPVSQHQHHWKECFNDDFDCAVVHRWLDECSTTMSTNVKKWSAPSAATIITLSWLASSEVCTVSLSEQQCLSIKSAPLPGKMGKNICICIVEIDLDLMNGSQADVSVYEESNNCCASFSFSLHSSWIGFNWICNYQFSKCTVTTVGTVCHLQKGLWFKAFKCGAALSVYNNK